MTQVIDNLPYKADVIVCGGNGYVHFTEAASTGNDIKPFASFVAERVRWSMEEAAKATQPA